jgi:hypothetical protein
VLSEERVGTRAARALPTLLRRLDLVILFARLG